jgi:hypothetical protein
MAETKRTISIDEMDKFEVDEAMNLYWRGKPVLLEQRLVLKAYERVIAGAAAFGALLAGLHPFLTSFGFIPK